MSLQMESKNCYHGRYSFRGFGRNLFNRMMNIFECWWFIAIIGEVYCLVWKKTSHIYFKAAEQVSLYYKKKEKINTVLQDALFAVDADKQLKKIIWFKKNFNRFYVKTVTTAEENSIDLPVLPSYLDFIHTHIHVCLSNTVVFTSMNPENQYILLYLQGYFQTNIT